MKKYLLFGICISLAVTATSVYSQAPTIEWQNSFGGTSYDYGMEVCHTTDGGFIIAGGSSSPVSGEKTAASYGVDDYWIIKTDAAGNQQWQQSYGGTSADVIATIQQTPDGGYIVGGYSESGISGIKTTSQFGITDGWILKLNSTGGIEWQKELGGSSYDYLKTIRLTSDGGYIVGLQSSSGVSGNKTEASPGGRDYWIVKLDASGNIIWQNTIGGNNYDYLTCVEQTADGGYIVGGSSGSGISGEKTETVIGSDDFWIIKLNSLGNIDWQNTIGGSAYEALGFIHENSDGTYFAGGGSASEISGDKTEEQIGDAVGTHDYWILKLSATGSIIWQNTIGGNRSDDANAGYQLTDGNYIVAGTSSSAATGDKTSANFGPSGTNDYWVMKLDGAGNIIWQNSMGGSNSDYLNAIANSTDGGYLLCGSSFSAADGNKTETLQGQDDIWLVKLEGECIPTTEICNALDDNCNGLIDDGVAETISISAGGATVFCQGGSVVLTATYSGTSVQWRKNTVNISGATNATYTAMATGNYSCVTSSACGTATSSDLVVTVNKNPSASIAAGGPTSFCAGGSVTLTETPVGGSTYQWYKGAAAIGGATTNVYVATTAGNYKCRVTKTATGCFKNSNSIAVFITCREDAALSTMEVSIYPNPASGFITIETGCSEEKNISICDAFGQHLQSINTSEMNATFNVENLPAGVYYVLIHYNDQFISRSFSKQ